MPTLSLKNPKAEGLRTDVKHVLQMQREAIPIIFVPGIMGSKLKVKTPERKLPDIRWDPGGKWYMYSNYINKDPLHRKRMLIGPNYDDHYLLPASDDEDGFDGLMDSYVPFLKELRAHDWGPLGKTLVFPVYAFPYNWTASCKFNGDLLADRIKTIIEDANKVVGVCKQVILLTHSMGGLVARSAVLQAKAKDLVLGIIHGVQPAMGAPAAYWRMKAGFDDANENISKALGPDGPCVTAVLANSPGGLELLPNQAYASSTGKPWFTARLFDNTPLPPIQDPYEEIYKVPAELDPKAWIDRPNRYWGLVDPQWLNPREQAATKAPVAEGPNATDAAISTQEDINAWKAYVKRLDDAKAFHRAIGTDTHDLTYCFVGTGKVSAETIDFSIVAFDSAVHADKADPSKVDCYPKRAFRAGLRGERDAQLVAVLNKPNGTGDATVPRSSADAIVRDLRRDGTKIKPPGNLHIEVEHQPAYESEKVQAYVIKAINALSAEYLDKL